ncbi:prenyltransferase/squalene oxidase repeat-containing protein [Streptomyces sp. TR06-5]|uniref:prenyltransferase/squalene oxidase repeat-containing protein n=1 Tax=Streptomyces sp. TR06-5 TaxID=3385976 RepID=UPI0039A08D9C
MFLRRSAAALAAGTVLCAVAAPAATAVPRPAVAADKSKKATDPGLHGTADPTYDGVWRQSLALLAQDTAGVAPSGTAVDWLDDQQCADGSFTSFRPDTSEPCGPKTPADTNATAAAVQALAALGGQDERVGKAVDWLKSVQNDDGGWGFNPGSPSDANSVSVVVGALGAAGEDPAGVTSRKNGASAYDALLDFRLGCDADKADRGAFAYQPDKKGGLAPNADATAAAALAGRGEGFVVEPGGGKSDGGPAKASCQDAVDDPAAAADHGTAYLAGVLRKNDWHLTSALPGSEDQPDYGNTADAVIALSAGGRDEDARSALGWLKKHVDDWDASQDSPAALGQLVLAAHSVGADPRDFGGVDLVQRLNSTGPKPAGTTQQQPAPGAQQAQEAQESEDSDGTWQTLSVVGAFLVAGVGIGILFSGRRKKA